MTATRSATQNQADKRDHRREVTDSIIKMLEDGVAPWQKPWVGSAMPFNPTTERSYRGGNAVHLLATGIGRGYADPRWMTYKQAADQGWQVPSKSWRWNSWGLIFRATLGRGEPIARLRIFGSAVSAAVATSGRTLLNCSRSNTWQAVDHRSDGWQTFWPRGSFRQLRLMHPSRFLRATSPRRDG